MTSFREDTGNTIGYIVPLISISNLLPPHPENQPSSVPQLGRRRLVSGRPRVKQSSLLLSAKAGTSRTGCIPQMLIGSLFGENLAGHFDPLWDAWWFAALGDSGGG